ncbi:hypothetical protein PVAG01_00481 [Phlyctema vagabunda]|uniref:Phosphoribosyltransferase domain-containing protein n=1 Tax=Phlyctema vagabunda TaxID=108571 RepID=A0ABR4PUD7_9HELO
MAESANTAGYHNGPETKAEQHVHFTEPTSEYWQAILPSTAPEKSKGAPWQYGVPAVLPDARVLMLPIRQLWSSPREAVASLMINHASFAVVDELGTMLGCKVQEYIIAASDHALGQTTNEDVVVVGLPTLGLSVAPLVAKGLGLTRYIPLGYSKKFWYEPLLSTAVSSITSPGHDLKRAFLDPNLFHLLHGKSVVIVDDAVSSGKTLQAIWDFLESEQVGCEILAAAMVMKQGDRWRQVLGQSREKRVVWVFESPLLKMVEGGWDVRT